MNLLRIEQTYGKIGIDTYNSQLRINSRLGRLDTHQTFVQVEMEKELPKVLIDQHECFATAGLKNNMEILEEAALAADRQALEYTARKAQNGDLLANLKFRGNAIASIARSESFHQHEFNIDLIPKARPSIDVQGYLNINFRQGQILNEVREGFANINFTEPKINMYVLQKPSVNIEYIGNNIDIMV